jgi:hypothetical protein
VFFFDMIAPKGINPPRWSSEAIVCAPVLMNPKVHCAPVLENRIS